MHVESAIPSKSRRSLICFRDGEDQIRSIDMLRKYIERRCFDSSDLCCGREPREGRDRRETMLPEEAVVSSMEMSRRLGQMW